MSGLLKRAIDLRNRLVSDAELDKIPLAEREKILEEIDEAVNSTKTRIHDDIYLFESESNDVKFPLAINLASIFLIIALSIVFYFAFTLEEDQLISDKFEGSSVENRIIRSLKEDSERQLSEKEKEILQIQNQLERIRIEQENLELTMKESLAQSERELRDQLLKDLESEKAKLLEEGMSEQNIETRMDQMEQQRERALELELASLENELNEERLSGQTALADQIDQYEKILANARNEKLEIEREYQEELSIRENQLLGERNQAIDRIRELESQKDEEIFLLNQFFSRYDSVRKMIDDNDETGALEQLGKLEELVIANESDGPERIRNRKDLDLFLIDSLKQLVTAGPAENPEDETALIIAEMVDKGNRDYREGDYESSKENYLKAISYMPRINESYRRLQSITEIENEQIQGLYKSAIEQGDREYDSGEYGSAISEYEKAIVILENSGYGESRLVPRYAQAWEELKEEENRQIITEEELAIISDAALREQSREKLRSDLTKLENMIAQQNGQSKQNGNSELISLLNIKVQIKEILTSDTVREQYPDLYEDFDRFVEAIEEQNQSMGKVESLEDVLVMTESLSGEELKAPSDPDSDERELLIRIIENLKTLITSL